MKRFFVFLGVVFATIGSAVRAQEVESIAPLQKSSWGDAKTTEVVDYIPDISLDMRFGYNQDFAGKTGRFAGDALYLDINGYISPHFSYSLNQTLAASFMEDCSGFNGTNWLTLTYETGDFAVTAGKDALLVGSFEYDTSNIDSYFDMNSMFYNMLDCWQWGVSAAWYPAEGQSIILQAANSPFSYDEAGLFAYNAAWRGEWDFYESYWTANMWQYDKGSFVKALNLSNRFYLGDFTVDLEYMTRAADIKTLFKDDFTLMVAPSYENDRLRVFAKLGWESVAEGLPYELAYEECIGSDYIFYGAGVEFFPLKEDKDVRLHAAWSSSNIGANFLNIGVTWKFDLTKAGKYLFSRLDK